MYSRKNGYSQKFAKKYLSNRLSNTKSASKVDKRITLLNIKNILKITNGLIRQLGISVTHKIKNVLGSLLYILKAPRQMKKMKKRSPTILNEHYKVSALFVFAFMSTSYPLIVQNLSVNRKTD